MLFSGGNSMRKLTPLSSDWYIADPAVRSVPFAKNYVLLICPFSGTYFHDFPAF